jgi:hypothetical protein
MKSQYLHKRIHSKTILTLEHVLSTCNRHKGYTKTVEQERDSQQHCIEYHVANDQAAEVEQYL